MMALTQENVHYTLNSVMNKSNRVHARIQEFLSGRGGGGRGPTATYFTVYRVDPMVLLQSGGGGPTSSRWWGCPKKPIKLVIFQGGGGRAGPLTPLWIRTWGRLTPLFAYRILVYQNLDKTEKIPPNDDLTEKKLSPAGRDSKCGSRGGSGGPDPPGKSQVIWVSLGYKQLDPP